MSVSGKELFERDVKRTRNGELTEQQVSPDVRVLCGLVALGLLWTSGHAGIVGTLLFSPITLAFVWLAAFGCRVPVIDPEASARFRELADPTRALPDDAVAREPVCEERPRDPDAPHVPPASAKFRALADPTRPLDGEASPDASAAVLDAAERHATELRSS